jgi:hypothetical protein
MTHDPNVRARVPDAPGESVRVHVERCGGCGLVHPTNERCGDLAYVLHEQEKANEQEKAEHLRKHITDGRWHDRCKWCALRRLHGGNGVTT